MEGLTEDKAKEVMKSRGYSFTAEILSSKNGKSLCFVKRITAIEATLHANVELNSSRIELDFVELKYFCRLCTGKFDFFHKEFEKLEQIMYTYAAQCLAIDVFAVLDSWREQRGLNEPEKESKPKKTIKERKLEFWTNEILPVAKKRGYPKDECMKFYNHYTAINPGAKRMLFEKLRITKAFDTSKRMTTWFTNFENYKRDKVDRTEKTANKQNEELKKNKGIVKKNELF